MSIPTSTSFLRLGPLRLLIFVLLFFNTNSKSQDVYYHVSNREVYDLLDELANEKIITLNSAIKPYSREFIAEQLFQASQNNTNLTTRQIKEIEFYLRDFGKELHYDKNFKKRFDLYYYADSIFRFSVNPIIGGQAWKNENGTNFHRWGGAEAFAYIGKHFGVYASLRDNHEDKVISDTGFLNRRFGASYKSGQDFSEMRGGLTFKWKWGTFGLIKDHNEWGDNYHYPNIISTKAPSFAQIKLQLNPAKWFKFNYFHGWLVSEVIDSSRSYNYNGIQRNVFHSKYMAANLFTFIPCQGLNLSFGNSVIYSDVGVQPAYLIPVFFYKSVDHTYNGGTNNAGQNSQLYFNVSCRLIPKMHLYYAMYLDDLSFERMLDPKTQSNHWSMKGGIRISNLIPNLALTAEYTRTNPLAYQNDNTTTLYNSNWFNMGHYLDDNADVLYLAADFKPLKGFHITTWYEKIRKGPEYPYIRATDPATGVSYIHGKIFLESVEWEQLNIGITLRYQPINDLFFFAELEKESSTGNEQQYTPSFYWGNNLTYSLGMKFGF